MGIIWLIINRALDIAILLPLSGSTVPVWFMEIGLRYLMLPIMAMAFGYTLRDAGEGHLKEDTKMQSS